jgi:hypothetical protein
MLLAALLLAAGAAPPSSQSPADSIDADVRCFATVAIMENAPDPAIKSAAQQALLYWMGRVNSRLSDAELMPKLADLMQHMTPADFEPEAKRCGAEMEARGDAMQQMGKALHDLAEQLHIK